MRLLAAALFATTFVTQAAYAQHMQAPASSGPSEKEKAKLEDKRRFEQDTDEAYKSTIKRIPEVKQSADPWGNLRAPGAK